MIIEDNKSSSDNWNLLKQVGLIFASRFLLLPSVGFFTIKTLKTILPLKYASLFNDPVLLFVLLIETCMPSAQNSTVILQLQNRSGAAAVMAKILLLIYILGVPAMSYWIAKILSYTALLN